MFRCPVKDCRWEGLTQGDLDEHVKRNRHLHPEHVPENQGIHRPERKDYRESFIFQRDLAAWEQRMEQKREQERREGERRVEEGRESRERHDMRGEDLWHWEQVRKYNFAVKQKDKEAARAEHKAKEAYRRYSEAWTKAEKGFTAAPARAVSQLGLSEGSFFRPDALAHARTACTGLKKLIADNQHLKNPGDGVLVVCELWSNKAEKLLKECEDCYTNHLKDEQEDVEEEQEAQRVRAAARAAAGAAARARVAVGQPALTVPPQHGNALAQPAAPVLAAPQQLAVAAAPAPVAAQQVTAAAAPQVRAKRCDWDRLPPGAKIKLKEQLSEKAARSPPASATGGLGATVIDASMVYNGLEYSFKELCKNKRQPKGKEPVYVEATGAHIEGNKRLLAHWEVHNKQGGKRFKSKLA